MFWIVFTIFIGLVVVGGIIAKRYKETSEDSYGRRSDEVVKGTTYYPYRPAGQIVVIAALVLWLLITIFGFSMKKVGAGEVGVVRQFGAISGQVDEGINFIAPWQSVQHVSIQTQRHTFGNGADGPITAASSETQDVFAVATINYSVSETDVPGLIRNVGSNWFDVLIPSRVNQFIKQETAKWKTDEIIPHREEIRQAVLARLRSDLGENYSITIADFLIDNISFSPEYLDAIEAKQVAVQAAQAEINKTESIRAQAEQARVKARGAADAVIIAAQGQAEANNTINESLTPALIQWQAIQELGDNIQIALVPSGQGIILDPTTMLAPQPQAE